MQAGGAGQSIPVCKVNVIRCQKNDSVSKESKDHHPPDNYKSIPGRALSRNPSDCRPQHSSDGGWNAGDKQLDPLQCWNRFVVTVVVDGCCVVAESHVQSYLQSWRLLAAAAGHSAFLAGVTTRRMRGRRYEIPSTVMPGTTFAASSAPWLRIVPSITPVHCSMPDNWRPSGHQAENGGPRPGPCQSWF